MARPGDDRRTGRGLGVQRLRRGRGHLDGAVRQLQLVRVPGLAGAATRRQAGGARDGSQIQISGATGKTEIRYAGPGREGDQIESAPGLAERGPYRVYW